MDGDIRRLALKTAQRLMDHHAGIWQRETFTLGAGIEQEGAHGSGLPDAEGRSKFYASAIQNGWMTQNEVRALENMNRIDDADRLYIQQNMMPVDMIEEVLSGKSTETDSEAEPGTPATDNEDNNNEDESASE